MFKLGSYLSLMCTPKIWVALTEQINNYDDQFLHGRTAVEKVVLMYLLEERKKKFVLCKATGRKTPKGYPVATRNKCRHCDVVLCKVQCFNDYHSADT